MIYLAPLLMLVAVLSLTGVALLLIGRFSR